MTSADVVGRHPHLWTIEDFYRLAFIHCFNREPNKLKVSLKVRHYFITGIEPWWVHKYLILFPVYMEKKPDTMVWRTY